MVDFHLQVAGRLAEFRDLVKEVVRSACRTALLEAGFTPDDYFMDMDSPMGMYAGVNYIQCLSGKFSVGLDQGAKKVNFTAHHSGKLQLAFTSPRGILTNLNCFSMTFYL